MRQVHSSWTFIVLLLFCYMGTTARAQEENIRPAFTAEQTDWMGALPDTFPMCKLSIPGTHDSGARLGGPALQTQNQNIPAQLNQGNRAFDIRLQAKDGRLGVFHSTAFQEIYWETDVLPAFLCFLQEHPTETLIVSLKREGGTAETYATLLAASLEDKANRACFVEDFRPDLTLGDCRGKILFLHRDVATPHYPGAACSGWADDATCRQRWTGRSCPTARRIPIRIGQRVRSENRSLHPQPGSRDGRGGRLSPLGYLLCQCHRVARRHAASLRRPGQSGLGRLAGRTRRRTSGHRLHRLHRTRGRPTAGFNTDKRKFSLNLYKLP